MALWGSVCHVKGPLPPPPPVHKILLRRAACARSELGGHDMTGPIFPTQGGRISTAQVSYDLDFQIFSTFCGISQNGITERESLKQKI
jgi:hypothetical protein